MFALYTGLHSHDVPTARAWAVLPQSGCPGAHHTHVALPAQTVYSQPAVVAVGVGPGFQNYKVRGFAHVFLQRARHALSYAGLALHHAEDARL